MHATDLVGINGITRVLLVYTCQQGVYLEATYYPFDSHAWAIMHSKWGCSLILAWIPGNVGIDGNKAANASARDVTSHGTATLCLQCGLWLPSVGVFSPSGSSSGTTCRQQAVGHETIDSPVKALLHNFLWQGCDLPLGWAHLSQTHFLSMNLFPCVLRIIFNKSDTSC
jgi:hypothetical protein